MVDLELPIEYRIELDDCPVNPVRRTYALLAERELGVCEVEITGSGILHLVQLEVYREDVRRKGIGTRLLSKNINWGQECGAKILLGNLGTPDKQKKAAEHFYQELGITVFPDGRLFKYLR